jgi:hypothetical protein
MIDPITTRMPLITPYALIQAQVGARPLRTEACNVVYLPRVFPTGELDAEKDKITDRIVLFDNQSFGGRPRLTLSSRQRYGFMHYTPRAVIFTFGLNGSGTQNALLLTTGGQISDMV